MLRILVSAVAEAHSSVAKVAVAAPSLLLVPCAAEAAQHGVEWSLGMFSGPDEMRAAARSGARATAGLVKVAALVAAAIVTARFWAYDRDLSRALGLDRRERRFAAGLVLVTAAALAVAIMSGRLFDALAGTSLELPPRLRTLAPLLIFVLAASVAQKRSTWLLAGLLGDREMTIERAARLSSGRASWFVAGVLVLSTAPAMALHYGLNFAAVGLPAPLQMLLLAADSVLVGAMAVLIGNATWISYRDSRKFAPEPAEP